MGTNRLYTYFSACATSRTCRPFFRGIAFSGNSAQCCLNTGDRSHSNLQQSHSGLMPQYNNGNLGGSWLWTSFTAARACVLRRDIIPTSSGENCSGTSPSPVWTGVDTAFVPRRSAVIGDDASGVSLYGPVVRRFADFLFLLVFLTTTGDLFFGLLSSEEPSESLEKSSDSSKPVLLRLALCFLRAPTDVSLSASSGSESGSWSSSDRCPSSSGSCGMPFFWRDGCFLVAGLPPVWAIVV